MPRPNGARWRSGELALIAILFVSAAAYVYYCWPRAMVALDEGAYLYESKRILDGEVLYRDVFDLVGPTSFYPMALMFAVFGTSMETARWSMALLHGAIVALIYTTVRQLGVRPVLAAVISLTHIALFYPALGFASPHWVSTALTMVVFWIVLRGPLLHPGAALAAGAVTALVGLSQQPKGAATVAAVAIVLLRDAWAARTTQAWLRTLALQVGAYVAGGLLVALPILAAFMIMAGYDAIYEAWVYMPLVAYPQMPVHREGKWLLMAPWPLLRRLAASLPPMFLLNAMPLIVVVGAARWSLQVVKGVAVERRRPLFVAVVFSALAIASVWYQPNYLHFAVVGPLWLSLWADLIEAAVRRLEQWARMPLIAPAVATAALLVCLGFEMRRSTDLAWRAVGGSAETAFGTVDFGEASVADEVAALWQLMRDTGAKDVLIYPAFPGLYLLTDTSNPTRFQLLMPGYTTPQQFAEVEAILERERVPFVVRSFYFWGRDKNADPLLAYLRANYKRVKLPRKYTAFPTLEVMRRIPDEERARRRSAPTAADRAASADPPQPRSAQ